MFWPTTPDITISKHYFKTLFQNTISKHYFKTPYTSSGIEHYHTVVTVFWDSVLKREFDVVFWHSVLTRHTRYYYFKTLSQNTNIKSSKHIFEWFEMVFWDSVLTVMSVLRFDRVFWEILFVWWRTQHRSLYGIFGINHCLYLEIWSMSPAEENVSWWERSTD